MWWKNPPRRFSGEQRQPSALGRLSRRPFLESLEDRLTPAALLTIDDFTMLEGNDGVQNAVVTVRLTEPHGNSVTVNYSTADGSAAAGSDYSAVSGMLTFKRNQLTKTVLVPVQGDRLVESGEFFSVRLSGAKGAKIADSAAIVTLTDEEPRVSINDVSILEGNSGAAPLTFTLSLSQAYDLPVTVAYATTDGSALAGEDYTATSGTFTFAPNQTSQPIEVMVNGDSVVESSESFAVSVTTTDSYAQVARSTGTGWIWDNEPQISISDAYNYTGEGWFTFTVSISALPDAPVTVNFTTYDGTAVAGSDYEWTTGTLTFDDETTHTITVQRLDLTAAPEKYFYIELSDASSNATIVYSLGVGYFDYDYYWYYDPGCCYYYDPWYGYW